MKINILICDTFDGLLPDNIPSYSSMLINLFKPIAPLIEYRLYKAFDREFPSHLNRNELYLIPGSRAGAYEDKVWVKDLIEFIKKAHSKQIPLAGICFGHQVIAQALGGVVAPSGKGWGTGIRKSTIIDEKASKYFCDEHMQLFYNHNDQVLRLPAEAKSFATSNFCTYEGFTIGNHILTFQGHPEYTADYNRYLIFNHAQDEPQDVKDAALKSIDRMENMGKNAAQWMLDLII